MRKMALNCSTHHDYVHHQGWKYVGDTDDLWLRKPDGTLIPAPCRGSRSLPTASELAMVAEIPQLSDDDVG